MSENKSSGAGNSHYENCSQSIARFYALLDGIEEGNVGSMVAQDGVWHRQGAVLQGPAAVDQALGQRPKGRSSLHLVSNLYTKPDSPERVTARYVCQVFRHDRAPDSVAGPAPLPSSLLAVTTNEDVWVRELSGEWKLGLKKSQVVFRGD